MNFCHAKIKSEMKRWVDAFQIMSLAIVVIPRQVTSRVALSDLIEQGVTKGMGCEKPGKLIPLNGVPNLLWS